MTESILVVLPTLGERLDLLKLSLERVKAQEVDVNTRLIVVIPLSAKAGVELCQRFGAEIVEDPNLGLSAAINKGLTYAKNEKFYAWMGDDDLFEAEGLKTLVNLFSITPEAIVAYGGCRYIDPLGRELGKSNAGWLAKAILPWGPDLIPHPGTLFKISELIAEGGYNENLKYCMDLDLLLRLKKRGKFVQTKKIVSSFRWHPDSLTVAGRALSTAESLQVKNNHLNKWIRPFSIFWNFPVSAASSIAAKVVNKKALKLSKI